MRMILLTLTLGLGYLSLQNYHTYSAQHKAQQHIALRLADCMISPGLSEKQNQKTIAFSSPLLNTNVPPIVHNTRLSNISRSGWLTVWSHQVCLKSKIKRQLHFQVHDWTQMCHLQCTTQGSATYRAQVGWLYDLTRFVWKAKSKDNHIFKFLGSKPSRVHVLRQLRALFTQVASLAGTQSCPLAGYAAKASANCPLAGHAAKASAKQRHISCG